MLPAKFCLPAIFDFNRKLPLRSHSSYDWRGIQEDFFFPRVIKEIFTVSRKYVAHTMRHDYYIMEPEQKWERLPRISFQKTHIWREENYSRFNNPFYCIA